MNENLMATKVRRRAMKCQRVVNKIDKANENKYQIAIQVEVLGFQSGSL